MRPVQQFVKEPPAGHVVRCLHPDIRGIFAAVNLKAQSLEALEHQLCILHVICYCRLDLFAAFRRVNGLGGALAQVACTVEFGGLTA